MDLRSGGGRWRAGSARVVSTPRGARVVPYAMGVSSYAPLAYGVSYGTAHSEQTVNQDAVISLQAEMRDLRAVCHNP